MKRRRCRKPRYIIKNHFPDCYVGLPDALFGYMLSFVVTRGIDLFPKLLVNRCSLERLRSRQFTYPLLNAIKFKRVYNRDNIDHFEAVDHFDFVEKMKGICRICGRVDSRDFREMYENVLVKGFPLDRFYKCTSCKPFQSREIGYMLYYIFCFCQTDYIILEELNDIFIFLYKTSIEELIYDEGKTSVDVYEWLEGSLAPYFEMMGLEYNPDEDTFICCQTEAFLRRFTI